MIAASADMGRFVTCGGLPDARSTMNTCGEPLELSQTEMNFSDSIAQDYRGGAPLGPPKGTRAAIGDAARRTPNLILPADTPSEAAYGNAHRAETDTRTRPAHEGS